MSRVKKKSPLDIVPIQESAPVRNAQETGTLKCGSLKTATHVHKTVMPQAEALQTTRRNARLRAMNAPNDNVPGRTPRASSVANKAARRRKPLVLGSPADIANRLGPRCRNAAGGHSRIAELYIRETFRLSRKKAHAKAQEWFRNYPKDAYSTEIEFWRACDDRAHKNHEIELTMRRLRIAG